MKMKMKMKRERERGTRGYEGRFWMPVSILR
jgi:hypothetical protein